MTPEFFDALVLAVVVFGLVLAALRIRSDFRSGPRWPLMEAPAVNTTAATTAEPDAKAKIKTQTAKRIDQEQKR